MILIKAEKVSLMAFLNRNRLVLLVNFHHIIKKTTLVTYSKYVSFREIPVVLA